MVKIALNIPDCHIPWHDKKAYQIMLECAHFTDKAYGLSEINIMGDYADFYWCNLHGKLVECMQLGGIKATFKDEIFEVNKHLEQLRQMFPKAKIRFIEGNHEYRLLRWAAEKVPETFDHWSVPKMLKLEERDMEFVPFGKDQLAQCLDTSYYLRHEPYSASENCAGATLKSGKISLGFGHTHRTQSFTVPTALGQELTCRSMGWLGDHRQPIYSYIKGFNKWSQGFEFTYSIDGVAHHHPVRIIKERAVFNGLIF